MRRAYVGIAATAAVLLVGGAASAQSKEGYKPRPLNLQKEHEGAQGQANLGRSRMQSGDCQGALDAFDAALRSSIDPTLFRDRGLCHEKLGHAFPAMGDFRVYLTNVPDAPDAADITQRLRRLEEEERQREVQSPPQPDKYTEIAKLNTAVGAFGPSAVPSLQKSQDTGARESSPGSGNGEVEVLARDDDENLLSLRRGRGLTLGPFAEIRGWFFSAPSAPVTDHASLGDSLSLAECVGARVGYELGAPGGLLLEAGYEHFNSTNVDLSVVVGFTAQLAYEFRARLDPRSDNQLLVALGAGYEHLASTPANPQFSAQTYDAIAPRLRVGYRRLLAPSAGFDVALNAGAAKFVSQPGDQSLPVTFTAGVSAAFVWGL